MARKESTVPAPTAAAPFAIADVDSDVLTPREAARYLKLPLSTLYKLTQEGKIRGTKFGKHWRFLKSNLLRFMGATPEGPADAGGAERRAAPRVNCALPATFAVTVPGAKQCQGKGLLKNVSRTGAFLEVGELQLNGAMVRGDDPVVLELLPPSGAGTVRVEGRVQRVYANGKTALGIQFGEVPLTAWRALTVPGMQTAF